MLAHSLAYHPQSDGQTEVVNKCVGHYLRCYCGEKSKLWMDWLPLAKWWYNTSYHMSTKLTPFEALYDYLPPKLLNYVSHTTQMLLSRLN